jgi:hypothetical protein
MSTAQTLPAWQPHHAENWNRAAIEVPHTLHHNPLFSLDALASLIEGYPKSAYALVQTNVTSDGTRRWREGDVAGTPGRQVIDAIAQGTLWLNLRDVGRHDRRYADLLDAAYTELSQRMPGFAPRSLKMGILISSPRAQVHYHCDLPGQALWQIAGRKRVWVYAPRAPFLEPHALQDIAYAGYEFKLEYRPEFDAAAQVFDLEPGGMLTWPLNSPHRVDNHDCLNISVTTEHWTDENRRSQQLHLAHAVMRKHLGWEPRSTALEGPAFMAKAALQAAWRRSPWSVRVQAASRPIEFRLDPSAPGGIVELPGAGR